MKEIKNNILRLLLIIVINILFIYLPIKAQENKYTDDYLIIENVDKILIYNKYQQHITQKERKIFTAFIPIKILETNCLLNDNFTSSVKVELFGNIFYFVKNDRNNIIGLEESKYYRIYKKAKSLLDTIQIINKSIVEIATPDFKNNLRVKNEKYIERYFNIGEKDYVKIIEGETVKYGWLSLTNDIEYNIIRRNNINRRLINISNNNIIRRVGNKIEEVNKIYKGLFEIMNSGTKQTRNIPYWKMNERENEIVIVLEPNYYRSYYKNTIKRLYVEIESILKGTDYVLLDSNRTLIIRQK